MRSVVWRICLSLLLVRAVVEQSTFLYGEESLVADLSVSANGRELNEELSSAQRRLQGAPAPGSPTATPTGMFQRSVPGTSVYYTQYATPQCAGNAYSYRVATTGAGSGEAPVQLNTCLPPVDGTSRYRMFRCKVSPRVTTIELSYYTNSPTCSLSSVHETTTYLHSNNCEEMPSGRFVRVHCGDDAILAVLKARPLIRNDALFKSKHCAPDITPSMSRSVFADTCLPYLRPNQQKQLTVKYYYKLLITSASSFSAMEQRFADRDVNCTGYLMRNDAVEYPVAPSSKCLPDPIFRGLYYSGSGSVLKNPPASERTILCSFYSSLSAPAKAQLVNWCAGNTDPCSAVAAPWYGVICSAALEGAISRVTSLDFSGSSLNIGSVPSALFSLGSLVRLDLGDQGMRGPLPTALASLTALQYLNISFNINVDGSIPTQLGLLSGLKTLGMGNVGFNQGTIPSTLGGLRSLTFLDMSNMFYLQTTLPTAIFALTKLQTLKLDNMRIGNSALPTQIAALTNLRVLSVSAVGFMGVLPSGMALLTKMQDLTLCSDSYQGSLPSWIGNFAALTSLRMEYAHLTGTLPSFLGTLTNLVSMSLGGNYMMGSVPPLLGSLTRLQYLNLRHNSLTGAIPSSLCSLSTTLSMDLTQNGLGLACRPSCLANYPNVLSGVTSVCLTALSSDGAALCDFYNAVPAGVNGKGKLTNWCPGSAPYDPCPTTASWAGVGCETVGGGELRATSLDLLAMGSSYNGGTLPSTIGNLNALTKIELNSRLSAGTLPSSIGLLTNLQVLGLNAARLFGRIPTTLGRLTGLTFLGLSPNDLTGTIPTQLVWLTKLETLDLSSNKLTGPIPSFAGSALSYLSVRNNNLVGSLPSSFCSFSSSIDLVVQGNVGLTCYPPCLLAYAGLQANTSLSVCSASAATTNPPPTSSVILAVTSVVSGLTNQDVSSGFSLSFASFWRQMVASAFNIPLGLVGPPSVRAGHNGKAVVTTYLGPAPASVLSNKRALDFQSTNPSTLASIFRSGVTFDPLILAKYAQIAHVSCIVSAVASFPPTAIPTLAPTASPTAAPTFAPSVAPTRAPTVPPTPVVIVYSGTASSYQVTRYYSDSICSSAPNFISVSYAGFCAYYMTATPSSRKSELSSQGNLANVTYSIYSSSNCTGTTTSVTTTRVRTNTSPTTSIPLFLNNCTKSNSQFSMSSITTLPPLSGLVQESFSGAGCTGVARSAQVSPMGYCIRQGMTSMSMRSSCFNTTHTVFESWSTSDCTTSAGYSSTIQRMSQLGTYPALPMTIGTCFTVSYGGGNMQYYKAKSCIMPKAVDGQALCDLFNALTPASKSALTNWCPGSAPYDPCVTGINAWTGVTCGTVGGATRVSGLDISGLGLEGSIPNTIGYLDALLSLSAAGNPSLTGSFPSLFVPQPTPPPTAMPTSAQTPQPTSSVLGSFLPASSFPSGAVSAGTLGTVVLPSKYMFSFQVANLVFEGGTQKGLIEIQTIIQGSTVSFPGIATHPNTIYIQWGLSGCGGWSFQNSGVGCPILSPNTDGTVQWGSGGQWTNVTVYVDYDNGHVAASINGVLRSQGPKSWPGLSDAISPYINAQYTISANNGGTLRNFVIKASTATPLGWGLGVSCGEIYAASNCVPATAAL